MTISKTTRWVISGAATALIIAHGFFPSFALDVVTIVLLGVAVLPWVTRTVESVELPGGVKISLRDVEKAENKIETSVQTPSHQVEPSQDQATEAMVQGPFQLGTVMRPVKSVDPNLSLVGLRIEIEKRLRLLSNSDQEDQQPLTRLIRALQQEGVLDINIATGLNELIRLGNSAAHGAVVEPDVAAWANTRGDDILRRLDAAIARRAAP
jgi:hypothetical protein